MNREIEDFVEAQARKGDLMAALVLAVGDLAAEMSRLGTVASALETLAAETCHGLRLLADSVDGVELTPPVPD